MSRHVQIIAEIGSVHDGSFGNALKLIRAAKDCGADSVKFQTHIAEAETLRSAPSPKYFTAEPRFEYFKRTAFTLEQWKGLKKECADVGVSFLSSPFSQEAVDLLESIGLEQYKIPSGEVTNIPLIEKIARLGKPIILSSGMSSWAELDRAVETVRRHHDLLNILQCTSEYPCPYERVGLNVMDEMRQRYGAEVGLSDHTRTTYAALAAVALGATIIEKHFTFSRSMYGSDAANSLEPAEFADMVQGIRAIERILSTPVDKNNVTPFQTMKDTFEKSIVTLVNIPAGERLRPEMLGIKKPGIGLSAARWTEVIGKRTARAVAADVPLHQSDILWNDEQNA